ncbi:MAG: WYL domain-containing protein [Paludibacteraceae bacterium]|nr:WYL domain-containing protein [Paludibacteraceae bacterium]
MRSSLLLKEYVWIVETIRRRGRITLAELRERWEDWDGSEGRTLSRTTFNRHREGILDVFGVIIGCNRRENCYYIENEEVLGENSVRNWLYSTLSVGNMLEENRGLQDRIVLERVPSGNETLQGLLNAMRHNRKVRIAYRKYGEEAASAVTGAPYCVKLFRRRWYVLVRKDDAEGTERRLAMYSLDRMEGMEELDERFEPDADFDAQGFFAESFGAYVDSGRSVERVVMRAYGKEPYYMRDLPMHASQRETGSGEGYADFEVRLRVTPDFKGYLLSRGDRVEVLEPGWLADEMRKLIEGMLGRYRRE